MILRPVRDTEADAEAVQEVSDAAFTAASAARGEPVRHPDPADGVRNRAGTRHLARNDPQGCWLTEEDGRPVGVALSARREGTWILALLAVRPEAQGKGVGRTLLKQAGRYGQGCLRGMLCASPDPRAVRGHRAAGFTLHPAMELHGRVDRSGLRDPGEIPVHPGGPAQRHLLESVDRLARGASHGPDHGFLALHSDELLVADTLAGSGYCYRRGGRVVLLAATSRRLAARLLREALARVPDGAEAEVAHLTAAQEWAVDVGLEAGLELSTRGYVALRGMRPPSPYVPHGGLL
ncbi:GNAT family N-acetyltransferase [Streptomyces sp. NPDC001380]|uniref:GNAT family N-acetyltransferase n=1 Tax=Streptomyces sp. NPDC001380 TaxID=3364566 RepID=UPI00369E8AC6